MLNINIKSTNFNMTSDIEEYITNRMESLHKYIQVEKDEEILIEFEIEHSTHHKNGEVFRAEANFTLNGIMHRGESTSFDAQSAIDEVKNQLEKQIRRSKNKRFDLFEKGSRIIKSMLRKK